MSLRVKFKIIGILVSIILTAGTSPRLAFSASQLLEVKLEDGVALRVHLSEQEGYGYASEVLQAACIAYKEIVLRQGFNRDGYTFSKPTPDFIYDSDKAIDIYFADVPAPYAFCQHQGAREYKAEIFIPQDRQRYQERYRIDQPQLELKASLIHELLHIITYSYNRNIQTISQGKISLTAENWDWYTEGLARYFETLVGYREEFLSSGFRKNNGSKLLVYKGGINYFLKYPNKPLSERKYDFALFWQYLDQNYGMDKIEEICAKFRQIDPQVGTNAQAMQIIAQTVQVPLKNLLRNFSLYVYKISCLPSQAEEDLRPVETSKLSSQSNGALSIFSFGFAFYEIDLSPAIKSVNLKSLNGQGDLNCMCGISSPFSFSSLPYEADSLGRISLDVQNLPKNSRLIIMLSNPTDQTIPYAVSFN